MKNPILGIIGGGQLGSMLSDAAKKINIKTVVYSDVEDSPAQNFCDEFILGKYDDEKKIEEFKIKREKIEKQYKGKEKLDMLYKLQAQETGEMRNILTQPQFRLYEEIKPKYQPLEVVE